MNSLTITVQDMGIDHRGTDVFVSKQFLHGANIVAIFKKMCGKRMPQRVAACRLKTHRHSKAVIRVSESRRQRASGGAAAEFDPVAPGAPA